MPAWAEAWENCLGVMHEDDCAEDFGIGIEKVRSAIYINM